MPDTKTPVSPKADLLLHPVRLRIVTTIAMQRMTAKDLAEALPDVPQTTLYRHINALVAGGMLKIVEKNPIRGTVERVYAVAAPPSLTPEDLRGLSKAEYAGIFTLFLSTLMGDAQRYLERQPEGTDLDFLADGVDISKIQLHLNDEEFQELKARLWNLVTAAAQKAPAPGRRRRVFSYVFIPGE